MYSSRYSTQAYQSQNYDQIKATCLQRRCLFEDPQFPADYQSVFGPEGPSGRLTKWNGNIVWRRPVDLVNNPQFIADGVSRFDVIQGELGNCWFIAAVANLTLHRDLFVQVVPFQSNAFDRAQYCGLFQFRFWQYGAWVNVVVDDRLPCDRRGDLLFLHSSDRREFWSALLEKAYAKLHGCYSVLAGGTPSEALQDFSGGIIEMIDFDDGELLSSSDLWRTLKKAYERNSLITCVLSGRRGYYEERTQDGLVRGHAYSITSVQQVHVSSRPHQLVRIRNPWGDHYEWRGSWSDGAREWSLVDHITKARVGYNPGQDGEFWMGIQDFCRQFTRAEVCHVSPDDSSPSLGLRPAWNKYIVEGIWARGRTAGGCMNHSSYETNPQFFFRFVASDADGDGDADKCTVIVSLIQKAGARSNRDLLSIGFRLFKAPGPGNQRLDFSYLKRYAGAERGGLSSGAYTDAREVSTRFEVETGHYCIVPSTFLPDDEGEFLLRVFSEPESGPPAYGQQGIGGVMDSFKNMNIGAYPNRAPAPAPITVPNGCPYPMYPVYGAGPSPSVYPSPPATAGTPGFPIQPPPAPVYPPPAPSNYGPPPPAAACPYPTAKLNSFPVPTPARLPSTTYAVNSSPYEQQPPLNPAFATTGPPQPQGAQPPYPSPLQVPATPYPMYPPVPGAAGPYPPAAAAAYPPAAQGGLPYPRY